MNFPHYEPQSDVLREFIDLYYFLEKDYEQPSQFFAFPHYYKPMNIHRGIEYSITGQAISVHGTGNYRPQILLQGVYREPIMVKFTGEIQKLTIIFKDGALDNFIDEHYVDVASQHSQLFTAWEKSPDYAGFLKAFFEAKEHQQQIVILETFLLSILNVKKDYLLYKQASTLLKDVDANYKISEIAQKLFLSEKTLHRLVMKYTGLSPRDLKKIIQFRHSLQTKVFADNFKSLTDIAYTSNYYDASYFNKIYKSLTLKSPKEFFKNVDLYCNNKLVFVWQ